MKTLKIWERSFDHFFFCSFEVSHLLIQVFLEGLQSMKSEHIKAVRGRGLFQAIVIEPKQSKTAWDLCLDLMEMGLLAKQTHTHIIRFAPPLTITRQQVDQSLDIINDAFQQY